MASKAMSVGDEERCTRLTERAVKAEEQEQILAGRWFECLVNGNGWDLSEKEIEQRRAEGKEVEVITEII
jgi:hypothetical protein